MFDRTVESELLGLLKDMGIGMIVFSPLAEGLLTDRYLNGIPADSRAARATGHLKKDSITPKTLSNTTVERYCSATQPNSRPNVYFLVVT